MLRFIPLSAGGPKFYTGFMLLIYISFPLSLSLFHLLDPTNPMATPILYNGLPITFLVIITLTVIRHFLHCFPAAFPKLRSNYKNALLAIALTAVAFMCQKPSRLEACDPQAHKAYKYTHQFWHFLVALASFFYHRFCFFEVAEDLQPLQRDTAFSIGRVSIGGGKVKRLSLGGGGVRFEERSSLVVEEGGREISVKGVEVLL